MGSLVFLYQGFSGANSVLKMIGLIILCALIIAASYYTTRFVGRRQAGKFDGGNFKAVDTFRLSNNKYLQIIKVGSKYFLIAVSKDNVSLISELEEGDLKLARESKDAPGFKQILSGIVKQRKKGSKEALEEQDSETGSVGSDETDTWFEEKEKVDDHEKADKE